MTDATSVQADKNIGNGEYGSTLSTLTAAIPGVVASNQGVFRQQGDDWVKVESGKKKVDGRALASSGDTLWVGTKQALLQIDGDTVVRRLTVEDGLPANNISSLCVLRSGALIVGTSQGFAVLVDGVVTAVGKAKLAYKSVERVVETDAGELWFAAWYKKKVTRVSGGQYTVFKHTADVNSLIPWRGSLVVCSEKLAVAYPGADRFTVLDGFDFDASCGTVHNETLWLVDGKGRILRIREGQPTQIFAVQNMTVGDNTVGVSHALVHDDRLWFGGSILLGVPLSALTNGTEVPLTIACPTVADLPTDLDALGGEPAPQKKAPAQPKAKAKLVRDTSMARPVRRVRKISEIAKAVQRDPSRDIALLARGFRRKSKLFDPDYAPWIVSLAVTHHSLGAEMAAGIAGCTEMSNLTTLNLSHSKLGDAGCASLADAAHLEGLQVLYLADCGIGQAGIEALVTSSSLESVRVLDLSNNQVGVRALEVLSRSPLGHKLKALSLARNSLDIYDLALVAEGFSSGLETLDFTGIGVGSDGMSHLLDESRLEPRWFILNAARLGDAGIEVLTSDEHAVNLEGLKCLQLSDNGLTDASAVALASCAHLSGLEVLDLTCNMLTDRGFAALAESTVLNDVLLIVDNNTSPAGVEMLRAAGSLGSIPDAIFPALRTWSAEAKATFAWRDPSQS